jgi:AP-3 complex subunit sigma
MVMMWTEEFKSNYTLYFIFLVDQQESDLGILDLIQVFVEALDHSFESVCELDLIFNSDKVHYIVDEIIMGGMVLETNLTQILSAISEQQKLQAGNSSSHVNNSSTLGITSASLVAGKLLSSFSSISGG